MAATKLNQKFKIPLQTEIQAYMRDKKGWPEQFCIYYAERFWGFYASNGWKVSGKAAMKDWKAAFNSQWQNLKFKEDIDMLQRYGGKQELAKVVHIMAPKKDIISREMNDIDRLDAFLTKYGQIPTFYTIDRLATKWPLQALNDCYKIIRDNRLWDPTITKKDLEGLEERRLKATVIVRTMDYYGCRGWSFKNTLKARKKLL